MKRKLWKAWMILAGLLLSSSSALLRAQAAPPAPTDSAYRGKPVNRPACAAAPANSTTEDQSCSKHSRISSPRQMPNMSSGRET